MTDGFDILYRGPVSALIDGTHKPDSGDAMIFLKLARHGIDLWTLVTSIEPDKIWVTPCVLEGETPCDRAPQLGVLFSFPISELADAKECIIGRRRTMQ